MVLFTLTLTTARNKKYNSNVNLDEFKRLNFIFIMTIILLIAMRRMSSQAGPNDCAELCEKRLKLRVLRDERTLAADTRWSENTSFFFCQIACMWGQTTTKTFELDVYIARLENVKSWKFGPTTITLGAGSRMRLKLCRFKCLVWSL